VIRDGVPIVQVAHRFEVSRQAVHRWLRWYEAEGLAGLAGRSPRPSRCSHQMDPAVEVWVLEARRRNPDWGPRRLVHEAARAGVDPAPSRSGIYRALKRAGLIDPAARRRRDRLQHGPGRKHGQNAALGTLYAVWPEVPTSRESVQP
jgi:transposase